MVLPYKIEIIKDMDDEALEDHKDATAGMALICVGR